MYDKYITGKGQRLSTSLLGAMMCYRSQQWAGVSQPDEWKGMLYCNYEVIGRQHLYQTSTRPLFFHFTNTTMEEYNEVLSALGMLDVVAGDSRFDNPKDAAGTGLFSSELRPIWDFV